MKHIYHNSHSEFVDLEQAKTALAENAAHHLIREDTVDIVIQFKFVKLIGLEGETIIEVRAEEKQHIRELNK